MYNKYVSVDVLIITYWYSTNIYEFGIFSTRNFTSKIPVPKYTFINGYYRTQRTEGILQGSL
jgi:hypothetical protein